MSMVRITKANNRFHDIHVYDGGVDHYIGFIGKNTGKGYTLTALSSQFTPSQRTILRGLDGHHADNLAEAKQSAAVMAGLFLADTSEAHRQRPA